MSRIGEFRKYVGNPILTVGPPETFDTGGCKDPCILKVGGIYYVYYTVFDTWMRQRIGLAIGRDLKNLTKLGVVLDLAKEGVNVAAPYVVYKDGLYYLFHNYSLPEIWRIGYAASTSPEGPFTEQGIALDIGMSGEWDDLRVYDASIAIKDGLYYMLYVGHTTAYVRRIGVATSTNLISWTRRAENPVITEVHRAGCQAPEVFKIDNEYFSMYGTWDAKNMQYVRLAKSTDVITWTKQPEPTLVHEYPWESGWAPDLDGGVDSPAVLVEGFPFPSLKVLYQGFNDRVWQLGYAECGVEIDLGVYASLVGGLAPILFGLGIIGWSELAKRR